MAEVTETNELHTIIILKYKLLVKLYTNETRMHRLAQKVMKAIRIRRGQNQSI